MINRKEIIDRIKKAINDNDLNSYKEWAEEQLVEFYILGRIIVEIDFIGGQLKMCLEMRYEEEIINKLRNDLEEIMNILTKFASAKETFYQGYKKGILMLPYSNDTK